MKPFLRLFAIWLVPLLSISGIASSRQDPYYGTGGFVRDVYSDETSYAADNSFYRAPSRDVALPYNEYVPREQWGWTYDAYPRDPPAAQNPELKRGSEWGYPTYLQDYRGSGSNWGGMNRQQVGGSWGHAYSKEGSSRNGYAPAPARRYSFRGDEPPELGDWRGPLRRPEYRFRPLSETDRERLNAGAGWRPQAPRPAVDQPGYFDSVPSEETYGYQPDRWLRSYDDVMR